MPSSRRSPTSRRRAERAAALAAALALGLAGCSRGGDGGATAERPGAPGGGPGYPADTPLARIGEERLTVGDVRPSVALKVHRREVAIYQLLKREAEERAEARLLEREAERRGISVEALLEETEAEAAPASEAEVDAYFESHPEEADTPQTRPRIRHFLTERRRIEERLALLARLRAESGFELLLGPPAPPRAEVPVAGAPARGSADAPVTIVHFGSFSAPLSARTAGHLARLRSAHPGRIREVHRHFLNGRDERGLLLARLAVLAREAGRFWALHDRLYALEGEVGEDATRRIAAELGLPLEPARSGTATLEAVRRDQRIGTELGVTRAPTLFVNGRYHSGTFGYDALEALVREELGAGRRAAAR